MSGQVTGKLRAPGIRLLFAVLVGLGLTVPLLFVYALVHDRQSQATTAQAEIAGGWGGAQVLSGPIIVVPFRTTESQTVTESGKAVTRATEVEKLFYISPVLHDITTVVNPEERHKSIYRSVLYTARVSGQARFALPADLARFGVTRERLLWDRAELRLGVSDSRGLTAGGTLNAGGKSLAVQPGKGPAASGGQGFFAFLNWDGTGDLAVDYGYAVRGSRSLAMVPRGGSTRWAVRSSWASPSFGGGFLPEQRTVSDAGFTASWRVDKLALGQPPVGMEDGGPPNVPTDMENLLLTVGNADMAGSGTSASAAIAVGLIEPVNLYSKVERSVKYGFLFIGFTFLTFFLFDVVGGARVASAEYLLAGAGLVLFFVLLLAFAELIGFGPAYLLASAAIIGLLAAYSAAVLDSRRRGQVIGALLTGLYAVLYVLLSLEAWSLLIGSVLLFAALAGVMYATRNVDWQGAGRADAA
ncbi:MAG: inner membrane CreD family protein [Sphingomonadales bacterium]|nr:inner membrane CreD family protein [Sphingomonadales bacterium]